MTNRSRSFDSTSNPHIFRLYTPPVFLPPSSISPHRQPVNVEDLLIRTTKKCALLYGSVTLWTGGQLSGCQSALLYSNFSVLMIVSLKQIDINVWTCADQSPAATLQSKWTEITRESLGSDEHIEFPLFCFFKKNNITIWSAENNNFNKCFAAKMMEHCEPRA